MHNISSRELLNLYLHTLRVYVYYKLSTVNYAGFIIKKNFNLQIRPNKINVLVLRQRRPLKISADGMLLLLYRKNNRRHAVFLKKKKNQIYCQI